MVKANIEIIEYEKIYDEQIKDLLVELQNYLVDIDDWHTQILLPNYRKDYFKMTINKVNSQNGKIYLAKQNNSIIGIIIGFVQEKDDIDKLTNTCDKTGEIAELIVDNSLRNTGIGKKLLVKIEDYFKSINCKKINVEVFGPNKNGLAFYSKNDYTVRDIIVSKKLK